MTIRFRVNGAEVQFDGAADMPLLCYLRDYAGLTGTKFGCGIASCGAPSFIAAFAPSVSDRL